MKKTTLGFLVPLLCCNIGFAANEIGITNLRKLTDSGDNIAPSFSPTDNNLIAFTKQKYNGIYTLQLDNNRRSNGAASGQSVVDAPKSGFGFVWSPDGKAIVFRAGETGSTHAGLVDINNKQQTNLSDQSSDISIPVIKDGKVFFTKDGVETQKELLSNAARRSANSGVSVAQNNGRILIGGSQISKDGIACFFPKVSPDSQKISYECMDGLYVYHISTNQTISLGAGSNAQWSSNSAKLVYEQPIDNGHDVVKSDVFIVNADGSNKINLTEGIDQIVRRPSLSPDGKKLAVDVNGDIYVVDLVGVN